VSKPWIERLKRFDADTQKALDLDATVSPLLPPSHCSAALLESVVCLAMLPAEGGLSMCSQSPAMGGEILVHSHFRLR
jgi:hypothetical protein